MRALIPPSYLRHAAPAWLAGVLATLAWWVGIVALDAMRQAAFARGAAPLAAGTEGALLLALVAGAGAAGAVLVEGAVHRAPTLARVLEPLAAGAVGAWVTLVGATLDDAVGGGAPVLALRAHLGACVGAGLGVSMGVLAPDVARRLVVWAQRRWETRFFPEPEIADGVFARFVLHTLAGVGGGAVAAVAAYQVGLAFEDRALATWLACWLIVVVPVLLVSGVPWTAFRGWIRVRRGARPGWRVPLDAAVLVQAERFVGSFPVGMDVHLPAEDGVAPLHASVLARPDGTFAVRGLSQVPVRVVRFLEWVDLASDPSLPAPLETSLRDGDRVRLGDRAEIELVLDARGEDT